MLLAVDVHRPDGVRVHVAAVDVVGGADTAPPLDQATLEDLTRHLTL